MRITVVTNILFRAVVREQQATIVTLEQYIMSGG